VSLLVTGITHRSAPVALLESLTVPTGDMPDLLAELLRQPFVREAVVLSTCNRVEVFAEVSAFHGGLTDIGAVLARRAGASPAELAPHLSVHYESDAVRHTFEVASGLDSMVIGEAQILGQLRDAYALAAERDAAGRTLHELMQQALRVGKRAHTETGIDRAGQSVVSAALALTGDLGGRRALVVGAGSMGALALATLRRAGVVDLQVTNRSPQRAERLAELYDAAAIPFAGLADALRDVDLVVCATASTGVVLHAAAVGDRSSRPLAVVDLAVPHDVAPEVGALPGVDLVNLERLSHELANPYDNGSASAPQGGTPDRTAVAGLGADRLAVEEIVAGEVENFLGWLRGGDVAPTVAALRARADELVASELGRLVQRRPDLSDEQRAEVAYTVHRIVQRLLHAPTVRARELAAGPGGDRYAELVRELFDLEVPTAQRAGEIPEVGE
jgi:glutamyl-tRNA reductase